MTLNASARNYRVWVCRPGEDEGSGFEVTDYCSGESGGYLVLTSQPLDESGMVRMQGTLTLTVPPYDDRFGPWESQSRWAIGNHVIARAADEAGTLRPLPINHLYILSDPQPPYPGNWVLQVELGDRPTLLDGQFPESADSELESQGRSALVAALSGQLGMGFVGEIPGAELLGYEPDESRSIVEQAGELALGGYSALYQGRSGGLAATRIVLPQQYRLFKHRVGIDDAGEFQAIQSQQRPPSEVQVVCNESCFPGELDFSFSDEYGGDRYGGSTTTQGFEAVSTISPPAENQPENLSEVLASIRTDSWNWNYSTHTEATEEYRARGLTIPQDLYEALSERGILVYQVSPFAIIPAQFDSEVKYYESGKEGRLLKVVKSRSAPIGQALGDFYKRFPLPGMLPPLTQVVLVEQEVTQYFYQIISSSGSDSKDSKGQVRKISRYTLRLKGNIAASGYNWVANGGYADNPLALSVYESSEQTWRKRSAKEWVEYNRVFQAGRAKSGTVKAFLRLTQVVNSKKTSQAGELQPPAADRRPSDPGNNVPDRVSPNSNPQVGAVLLEANAAVPRKKSVTINQLEDKAHCERLAATLATIYKGRHQGFRIFTTLRDEWFSWKPLSRVDIDYNGYTYLGTTDLVTFTLAANSALVLADCLRLGRVNGAKNTPDSYPYPDRPKLLPSDPDPTPDPEPDITDLYPERLNTQVLLPIQQVIRSFVIDSVSDVGWTLLRQGAIAHPPRDFILNSLSEVMFMPLLGFESISEVEITLLPMLVIESLSSVSIRTSDAEPGLISYWSLDDSGWTDAVGGNDLTASGTVDAVAGLEGNAAQLSEFAYLYRDGVSNLITRPDGAGLWSWKFSVSFYTPDIGSQVNIASAYQEWHLATETDDFVSYDKLVFVLDGSDGSLGSVTSTVAIEPDTWYAVICELDLAAEELRITVNGVTTTEFYDIYGSSAPSLSVDFKLGAVGFSTCPDGTLIDEAKFYLLEQL